MTELASEPRKVREVLLEKLSDKKLGQATFKAEHTSVLLEPRRKSCSEDHFGNGGRDPQFSAELEVKSSEGGCGHFRGCGGWRCRGRGWGWRPIWGAGGGQKVEHDVGPTREVTCLERLARSKAARSGAASRGAHGNSSLPIQRALRVCLAEDESTRRRMTSCF